MIYLNDVYKNIMFKDNYWHLRQNIDSMSAKKSRTIVHQLGGLPRMKWTD